MFNHLIGLFLLTITSQLLSLVFLLDIPENIKAEEGLVMMEVESKTGLKKGQIEVHSLGCGAVEVNCLEEEFKL